MINPINTASIIAWDVNPFLAITMIRIIRKLTNNGREELINRVLGRSINSLSLAMFPMSVDAKNIRVTADNIVSNMNVIGVRVSPLPLNEVSNIMNNNIGKDIEYGHKGGDRFLIYRSSSVSY